MYIFINIIYIIIYKVMSNIICFLTIKPTKLFKYLCKELKCSNYEIYICADDNTYKEEDNDINIIQIDNKECEEMGYKSSVLYFKNKACARDKALYYFNENNIDYKYIWFIEEDVLIPTKDTIKNIDNKYIDVDLLSSSNKIFNNIEYDWHWKHVYEQMGFNPPYGQSMISAIRLSKKLMNYIEEYVILNKTLFLDEVLFNTLAIKNNLKIETPAELSSIKYNVIWYVNEINENNLYHPVKDLKKHYYVRKLIEDKKNEEIENKKKLLKENNEKENLNHKFNKNIIRII